MTDKRKSNLAYAASEAWYAIAKARGLSLPQTGTAHYAFPFRRYAVLVQATPNLWAVSVYGVGGEYITSIAA